MIRRMVNILLFILSLLQPAIVFADIVVDTESLHLRFSAQGDLIYTQSCFPACSVNGAKTRVLSARQGMLVFNQDDSGRLRLDRQNDKTTTTLTFVDQTEHPIREWKIPQKGWVISVKSFRNSVMSLRSGIDFRPMPSSGFGNLLEQSRYIVVNDSAVETISLDDTEQGPRITSDWFGFRNRFWTVMVLPGKPVSIHQAGGESVTDPGIDISNTGKGLNSDMILYLGPIEPEALSQVSPVLEDLMYSGLWFWLRWICQGLYALLNMIVMLLPQWGLAVMVLSLVVAVLMRPLSRIAENLQNQVHEIDARLAPKLVDIKKNHKGAEQSEKILAMYKEEDVHPLYSMKSLMGVFVVVPVFIGAFDMLAENIHLSGESFLWIADLSHPDALMALPFQLPFFGGNLNLLPFIMTVFSYIASRLHHHPSMDAIQQRKQFRNLVLMSLGFLVLFYTFPAGMVLYWTTNNLISVFKVLGNKKGKA